MSEEAIMYDSKQTCPACGLFFLITKIKSRAYRSLGHDSDMFPRFEGENPMFYDPIICPHCGFAHFGTDFTGLTKYDLDAIREKVTPKWTPRDFAGHRTVEKALEAYKLILFNLHARNALPSEFARICMRIAWMYRIRGDSVTEYKFIEHAFEYYKKTYTSEHLPAGKLDAYTCMYMVGELGLRLGKYEESMTWFGKLISAGVDPKQRDKIPGSLLETAKDQIFELKTLINRAKAKDKISQE